MRHPTHAERRHAPSGRPIEGSRCTPRAARSRGFTLVELLVVIAIISTLAGILVPSIIEARRRADIVHCQNNLREIVRMAILYADTGSHRFLPFGKGKHPAAHESFNEMLEFASSASPELFLCRTWRGGKAEADEEGRFLLDADTCSYTWTNARVAPSDTLRPIASDKHIHSTTEPSGHIFGMNVAFSDGSARFVPLAELELDENGVPVGLVR